MPIVRDGEAAPVPAEDVHEAVDRGLIDAADLPFDDSSEPYLPTDVEARLTAHRRAERPPQPRNRDGLVIVGRAGDKPRDGGCYRLDRDGNLVRVEETTKQVH